MSASTSPLPSYRRPVIDIARGFAVLAMVAYHFTWDLGYFHVVEGYPAASPLGRLAAHAIANGFLALVGISLVLADNAADFARKFWRRQLILGAAAAAISLATYIFMPESWIFFGILHCIFVCSLIGFALRKVSLTALVGVSVFAVLLPQVVALSALDHPALVWLGLGRELPFTNDFAPLFPSLASVVAGMIYARLKFPHRSFANDNQQSRKPNVVSRFLTLCGRYSLPIYLIHQPLLFGAFLGLTTLVDTPERRFEADCHVQCAASGGEAKICINACSCVTAEMKSSKLWPALIAGTLDDAGAARMSDFAALCGQKAKASQ